MSTELIRTLQVLQEEYAGQPPFIQQEDLRAINDIRSQLGMSPVNANLCEIGTAVKETKPEPELERVKDHTEARAIYKAYLKKIEELEVHRAYAERVAKATSGPGQTPVRPLATMGTDGGPLLCDECGKPMVLEGGRFQGVAADVAWKQSPGDNWNSWISGGLVVEIMLNGTLRIYHGYPGQNNKHCCNVARRNEEKAQARFQRGKIAEKYPLVLAFLEQECPDMTDKARRALLNEILNTMYTYDPGIGVNRPSGEM